MRRLLAAASRTALVAILLAVPGTARAQSTDDVSIELERMRCFGTCPVYTVRLTGTGEVEYRGSEFVRVGGRQTARIAPALVTRLLDTAERIGFFDLHDQYRYVDGPTGRTTAFDLPTTVVTIRWRGRTKRVEDYFGTPPELKRLEHEIDEAARTARWVRMDEEALLELARDGWRPTQDEEAELLRGALEHDEVGVVRGLLDLGADPNRPLVKASVKAAGSVGPIGPPPLTVARSAAAVRLLLDAGASPFTSNGLGWTPMYYALRRDPAIVLLLLDAGVPGTAAIDADGRPAIWEAACTGNLAAVRALLAERANPAASFHGLSALACARLRQVNHGVPPIPGLEPAAPPFTPDFDEVQALLGRALASPR
jgi:hypothetical protein